MDVREKLVELLKSILPNFRNNMAYWGEKPIKEYRMSNADRIRSMTDEELALWICGVYDIEEENGKFINGIIIPAYSPHDIEEWLQQPAEEVSE